MNKNVNNAIVDFDLPSHHSWSVCVKVKKNYTVEWKMYLAKNSDSEDVFSWSYFEFIIRWVFSLHEICQIEKSTHRMEATG